MPLHSISFQTHRVICTEEGCIPLNRKVSRLLGKNEAQFLQQLHYWLTTDSGKIVDGVKWIYNTYDEWVDQLTEVSKATLRRLIYKLENLGIIKSANFNKKKSDRTKWYTIVYEVFDKICGKSNDSEATKQPVDNVSSPCAQNELLTTKRLTSRNTGLNRAREETNQASIETIETFPPLVLEEKPVLVETEVIDTQKAIGEQIIQALEVLSLQLKKPLEIKKQVALKAFKNLEKSHFGETPALALERFKTYLAKIESNLFLMGKKAMKSLDRFTLSVGFIFSKKAIEDSWHNKNLFEVYLPKEQLEAPEESEMARKAKPVELPLLSLTEVRANAEDRFDKEVKEKLFKLLGERLYRSWFHSKGFVAKGFMRGEPDFFISSQFSRDYITTHFDNQLKEAFKSV